MGEIEDKLRQLPVEGYVFLNIRALNTEENNATFERFKEYSKKFCGNNYTLAIQRLMDTIADSEKYEQVFVQLADLNSRVSELERGNSSEEQKEETGVF